uniref:DM10 domain-containing protein n=1 Tax=Spongospora subterranea TaxID=70186 RepID=A0A0H5R6L4_9EUKA|eukprot:CRZ03914.1 hypothetical protein [Spongospora subterranea]
MAPPFLPGTSINPNPAHHHPRTTRFDIMQGQRLSDPLSHKLVPAPKHTNLFVWNQETGESRSQHDLHPKLHNMDVTMGRIPSWITYDGKVLRFTAYFRQAIQESQIETHRICPVAILFYLQDGTIRITETREDNNGMQHGAILQRHRMPLSETGYAYDGDHQFLSPEHIRIRRDLTLYSRVYRVVDCDQFTRQFYLDHLNVDLEPAEPIPDDPFHLKIKAAAAAVEAGRGHDHVSAHYESVHGKQQRWQLSKCRRFLEQDGKVLRFWAVWKHAHHSSEDRHLVVHFFLADDTCEVLEIAQPNSGRDPFPSLVKRQRLGKRAVGYGIDNIGEDVAIQTTSQRDQFYTAVDFQVGNVIRVFGRDVLLLRADPFTKQYYLDTFGIELHDMVDDARENERDKRPPEPESDHVEHEDEIVTSAIKAAKSARGKIPRSVEKQLSKSVMRFKARQVSVRPEDIAREFVISFFPLDDTVSVFENPIRNSGFLAGKVMMLRNVCIYP